MQGRNPHWDRSLAQCHRSQEGYHRYLDKCWGIESPADCAIYIGNGMWIDTQVHYLMTHSHKKAEVIP